MSNTLFKLAHGRAVAKAVKFESRQQGKTVKVTDVAFVGAPSAWAEMAIANGGLERAVDVARGAYQATLNTDQWWLNALNYLKKKNKPKTEAAG